MSYHGPNARRIAAQQVDTIFQHAGQAVTWRQYISASAGVSVAGFGSTPSYREQTITALFGPVHQPETQTPVGMMAVGELACTTRERLARQDTLVWNGVQYRIDSDPVAARITDAFYCVVKRGT